MADLHPLLADQRARALELPHFDLRCAGPPPPARRGRPPGGGSASARGAEPLQVLRPQEHAGRRRPAAAQRQSPEVAHVGRALQRDPP